MHFDLTISPEEQAAADADIDLQAASLRSEYIPSPSEMEGRQLPPIVSADDFIKQEIVPPKEIVHGVLHQGSKMAIGGGSKSFKTWTLLDLAVSVATGQQWLGFDTTYGKVLYLNFEIQRFAWQKRLHAVLKAKKLESTCNRLDLWNLRGRANDFNTLIPQIIERASTELYVLIVLDPIYKLYGRTDENKASDVAALMNSVESLAVETGASTAFGAHFSKGNQSGKEAIDRISGSGVFARDPDSMLMFTQHEAQNSFTVEPILRNFTQVDPFVVQFDFPLMKRNDELDPSKLKQSNSGRKKEYDLDEILKAIGSTSKERPVTISQWAQKAGISRTTITPYVHTLRNQGLVATLGEGTSARQFITQSGILHLKSIGI